MNKLKICVMCTLGAAMCSVLDYMMFEVRDGRLHARALYTELACDA